MAARGQGSFEADVGQQEGIEFWRIENMNPVKQPEGQLGELFSGDCYIFLHTYKRPNRNNLAWDLFFWQGAESTQDERGSVALRAVELDDSLGGAPIQYREVMGHESQKFLCIFPGKTIKTQSGGVDSAFNKVDRDAYEHRLFHLKGKRTVHCNQVPKEAASMNEGDVFILDMGKKLFQWNGKEANKYEKFKGLELVTKINDDERGGKCEKIFLDSGKNDEECKEFWADLTGTKADVKSAAEAGSDEEKKAGLPTLVEISDKDGAIASKVVKEGGSLEYKMLNPEEVYIVDVVNAIYVWVGDKASKEENRNAMKMAMAYVDKKGYPNHISIQKINMSHESDVFKSKFRGWPTEAKSSRGSQVDALYAKRKKNEEHLAAMDGEVVNIWRIKDLKKEALDESLWGQFWAGDAFIILYKYKINPSKDGHFIYFWQGRDASIDEKGASALLAKDLDDEMGGDPVQIRVVMGKEPAHFLTMFKGRMIVHHGGVASGFKSMNESDTFDTDGISLFHVRGSNEFNTRAVQVEEKASVLNGGDCFVLLTPETMFCWHGVGANDDEKTVAGSIAEVMKGDRAKTVVEEESEPEEFWNALGGKTEYAHDKDIGDLPHDPRLFQMTCNVGFFRVEEVFGYDQSDLVPDDVMMLDCFNEVFLWVGPEATRTEQDNSMQAALDFVAKAEDGRDADTPVYRVSAGFEPPNFTQHFLGWDSSKALTGEDPYVALLKKQGVNVESGKAGAVRVSVESIGFAQFPPAGKAWSLSELQAGTPPGCDPSKKEMYLSDEEFQSVFGISKDKFAGQAKWKQQSQKKSKKLF